MKRRLEVTEMLLHKKITWTEYVTNDEVLRKMETKRKLIFNIRKRVEASLAYKKEGGLGQIEIMRDIRKQHISYLVS